MTSDGAPLPRLNLGSGGHATPGWVCIDRSPNVVLSRVPFAKRLLRRLGLLSDAHMPAWDPEIVRRDIRSLPFPDGSVEAVYSSHTLEHVYLNEAKRVLAEAARVLQPGGMIRVALPDATVMARALVQDAHSPEAGWKYNEALLAHPQAPPQGLRALVSRAGGHVHRWQPTAPMVAQMLEEAGFTAIQEQSYRSGEFPDLAVVETRPESFFLEARKPS